MCERGGFRPYCSVDRLGLGLAGRRWAASSARPVDRNKKQQKLSSCLFQSLRAKTAPTATFPRRCPPWHEAPPGGRNHGAARGWAPRWVPPLCGVVRGRVCRVCGGPGLAKVLTIERALTRCVLCPCKCIHLPRPRLPEPPRVSSRHCASSEMMSGPLPRGRAGPMALLSRG